MYSVEVDLAQPTTPSPMTLLELQDKAAESASTIMELAATSGFCVNCASTGNVTFHLAPLAGDLLRPSGLGSWLLSCRLGSILSLSILAIVKSHHRGIPTTSLHRVLANGHARAPLDSGCLSSAVDDVALTNVRHRLPKRSELLVEGMVELNVLLLYIRAFEGCYRADP